VATTSETMSSPWEDVSWKVKVLTSISVDQNL